MFSTPKLARELSVFAEDSTSEFGPGLPPVYFLRKTYYRQGDNDEVYDPESALLLIPDLLLAVHLFRMGSDRHHVVARQNS